VTDAQLTNGGAALASTAAQMVDALKGTGEAEKVTRDVAAALVKAAKEMKTEHPVIAAIEVGASLSWSEVLTIGQIIQHS